MSWSHGSIPDIDVAFNVVSKKDKVCSVKFTV